MDRGFYEAEEDSCFFQDFLKKYFCEKKTKNLKFLDMGTGSGILAKTAADFLGKENVLTVDLNLEAVRELKKDGFNSVCSDLFEKINDKFDIIVFNAPYLPRDSREPKDSQIATTGGKNGDEISVKFLGQAKKHLRREGKIFLLISSLTPIKEIKKFSGKIVARKKIHFEELLILEF